MDRPPTVAFTAFTDAWPRAIEKEIGATLCAIDMGKDFYFFDFVVFCMNSSLNLLLMTFLQFCMDLEEY